MKNLIFLLILLIPSIGFASDLKKEDIKKAIDTDNISAQDCRKWYAVYYGSYLYVKEFDAQGCKDFGDVADRMRVVRDKLAPAKSAQNFMRAIDPVFSTYAEKTLSPETRTDFAEELFVVSEALKVRIGELE